MTQKEFEKAGDEVLELTQVVGVDPNGGKSERINFDMHKGCIDDDEWLAT